MLVVNNVNSQNIIIVNTKFISIISVHNVVILRDYDYIPVFKIWVKKCKH